jgi:hypothetical protein
MKCNDSNPEEKTAYTSILKPYELQIISRKF